MRAAEAYAGIMADDRLPSPSQVVTELLQETRKIDASIDEIVRLVGSDPAICARVMRTVNAPTSGIRRSVAVIGQAVTMLGLRSVARIAVEVSILERNREGLPEFDYDAYWSRSLARAVAAKVLAGSTRRVPADEAFTYGLLSWIGRLALVSVYPTAYGNLLRTLGQDDPVELAEAERAVFELDAEPLSALMLSAWGLPALHDAMSNTEGRDPARVQRDAALLQTCRAAELVARVFIRGVVSRQEIATAMQAIAALGLGLEVAVDVFPEIIATYHDTGTQLRIDTRSAASLEAIYAHAIDGSASPAVDLK